MSLLLKILGLLIMLFGFLMIAYFPGRVYQKSMMTKSGLWLGVIIFLTGIVMLVYL